MSDLTAKNREHANKHASDHKADFGDLIQAVIREFQTRRSWISNRWVDIITGAGDQLEVRLLDYACGAGTVSKALMPFVSQAVGLDLSENMVAEYNKYARDMGFGPERMYARQYDLLAESDVGDSLSGQELFDFDIIAVSMALHHVADPGVLLQRFAKRLRTAGVCVILDMVPNQDAPDLEALLAPEQTEVLKTINKWGFTKEEMRQLYEDAGLGKNFDYVVIEQPFEFTLFGHRLYITGFLARGELL